MSRVGSYRSIAPIRPNRPYETRSPSSTCAGSPEPSRPATYLTSGAYVRISRSRTALSFVRRNSSQRLCVSSPATIGEYDLGAPFPQCGRREGRHPGRESACSERDHPLAGGPAVERERSERSRDHREERGQSHAGQPTAVTL